MSVWPKILDDWKFHRATAWVVVPVSAIITMAPFVKGSYVMAASDPLAVALMAWMVVVGAWLLVSFAYAIRVSLGLAKSRSGVLRDVPRRPLSVEGVTLCVGPAIGVCVLSLGLFALYVTHGSEVEAREIMARLPTWGWMTLLYGLSAAAGVMTFSLYGRAYAARTN